MLLVTPMYAVQATLRAWAASRDAGSVAACAADPPGAIAATSLAPTVLLLIYAEAAVTCAGLLVYTALYQARYRYIAIHAPRLLSPLLLPATSFEETS